ncbi:MAG TPA: hypothetical protein PKJ00_03415 [Verrucomicrobiota bacterium]|nr:hypothetical protein [Verrucomicrobiota bacterium]HNS69005.1 hypothetical protein [Verrucomicrobiota bacterium]
MKIALVYVYPAVMPQIYRPLAQRFAASYMKFPPGATDHELFMVVNGGMPSNQKHYEHLLAPLPVQVHYHDNSGKDIGAFQMMAAELHNYDLMVCIGSPVQCRKAGWLDRMVMAYEDYGPGLYGAYGFHQPLPHIRTTVFWLPPALMNAYGTHVTNQYRYEFEHGTKSIFYFTKQKGFVTRVVTWDGCYGEDEWRPLYPHECLFTDQHMERMSTT